MIIVGALVEYAANGVDPVDGGVAVWRDGEFVFGMAEERVTRRKYQGGFRCALRRALDHLGVDYDDVDAYSFVSYGEPFSGAVDHIARAAPELASVVERVHVVGSHHDAHALGAARMSPWDHSLVVVYDNEGLVLGPQTDSEVVRHPMERATYYLATPETLDVLTRDLFGRDHVSLGEAYRRFSYYCGFPSHQFAGKTMALAAYGDASRFADLALMSSDGKSIEVDLDGAYGEPAQSIVDFFARHGYRVAPPRGEGEEFHSDHLAAAALVQSRLESAVTARIGWLLAQTGQQAVSLSGGVAYNCKLVAHLEKSLGVPVFVPPSPGDQGLGVGAALLYIERRVDTKVAARRVEPVVRLGSEQALGLAGAKAEAGGSDVSVEQVPAPGDLALRAVSRLRHGGVVAIMEGRSEFGRRALGARSLLSLPDGPGPEKLRELKRREWFRPFGASILATLAAEVFDDVLPDAWMLRAPHLADTNRLGILPHVDGTLRAQMVPDDEPTLLGEVLRGLVADGLPGVVVNTSFNLDGAPLVETEAEGVRLFLDHPEIDVIVLASSHVVLSREREA